jgi:RNA polymerase sigma-70 factor (ECF subfamily)
MKSWTRANTPQNSNNTTELTRRIRAGSRRAEAEFAEAYSRALLLMLLNRTQNPDIAKDCCQQALLIALIKLRAGEIVKPESLLSFLRSTATNVAKTHFRKERRYISLNEETFSAPIGNGNDAEQDIDSETIRLMLNDVLDSLTVERDKEILRRFYLRDEDKSIIRRDLHISAAHFDRVIYRAKGRLRRLLNGNEDVKTLLRQSLSNRMRVNYSKRQSQQLQ